MKHLLVFDWPTRIFHWLFATSFLTAFVIVKVFGDESAWFPYHMLAGITLGALVVFRLVWGFVGSRYARFSGFHLKTSDLKHYVLNLPSGNEGFWTGHNPASSWAALTMLMLGLGLAISGPLMVLGIESEVLEEVHEVLANSFLVVAGLHVFGVLLHTIRHQEIIGLSMIHGRKRPSEANTVEIESTFPVVGLFFGLLAITLALTLVNSFDAPSGQLKILGLTLQLDQAQGERRPGDNHESEPER